MNQEKHYNTLTEYYQNKINRKVAKIALNANFTCPNRDGTKGYGGCSYCSKLGSGDTAGNPLHSIKEQYFEMKSIILKKWPNALFVPYLQAYSNTYAPLDKLKDLYEGILELDQENIVELAIATRADCFTKELYDYLEKLNQRIPLSIELGLQTSNEATAQKINRLCTNKEFIECVTELKKRNMQVVVHIINGLPNETENDMLNTIDFINALDIDGIKIHSLLLLKDTLLYEQYQKDPFPILALEEYVSITVKQIARLKPSIIIHRLAADGIKEDIILPKWPLKKLVVMNEIDKLMRKLNIYQGDDFK
ncbi:MAG: TIGR01212 family radical SAM protein [Roseburia sp.]|nr:TIGR01212 family radical SAM protein [Anaeroplasma bactoclasticum]MCM1196052.1 TIGR01212 family radical SAM protein [Roseburia sp.]MCM1556737.1 TIGR01212 family radical SAM protein [Anaeroplasma bactoclasticum]